MRQSTIDAIALGATRSVEGVLAAHPGAGPAEREIPIRMVLAEWIAHAVKREALADRKRVARRRA